MVLYLVPVIGAAALAGGFILEKVVLNKKKINVKFYQAATFTAIVIVMLPFLYYFWKLDPQAYKLSSIIIFLLVVIFSVVANMFTFFSMKWEKLSNLEPAKMTEPIFTILFAIVFSFFTTGLYERDFGVIVPALIAGAALIFSHVKKHHLDFNKYFTAALLGSLFFALELVTSRLILDFYSPLTFYFLRCSAVLVLSIVIFRPKWVQTSRKVKGTILMTGAIWVLYRNIVYFGYLKLGVIFTTLMIMLGPVFVYLFAYFFLRDKPTWKNIAASIVIVAAVLYAAVF